MKHYIGSDQLQDCAIVYKVDNYSLDAIYPAVFRGNSGQVRFYTNNGMPQSRLPNLHYYEDLLDGEADSFQWPEFDENAAALLCYTSGTTGNPKGALYSHRSTMLHALCVGASFGQMSLSERDAFLVIVPMFHVCAWGTPFMAPMCGSKLVFPGPAYDGPSLFQLMDNETE